MIHLFYLFYLLPLLLLTSLACGQSASPFPSPTYTPEPSVFESGRTAYGFFPTPPEVSLDSVFATYKAIGQHADVVLVQENIPWADFVEGVDVESQARKRRHAQASSANLGFVPRRCSIAEEGFIKLSRGA